ncbi:hypothetical protein HW114_05005 [Serratia symbiotica]|uniref:hypothetical protein n=1 Tax=Serratia symbiotica TaxID=138074 RepID=UPI001326AC98|nr:hypothetical protein [Serratia symbiotica]MBF1994915.1 hypothetical protein [Serratia symbiotica]MBQ0954974.1 hypothetical protein [Serratia symbiotica]QTP14381.1 hypothetical protein GPZ83_0013795 [Serratia symbiotica]
MDSALPPWLWRWLNLPAGQLLAMQWLGLSILAVLAIGWLWQDEGQQRARIATQRRQLMQQIEQRQRQLAQIPAMETMDRHWQLATEPPAGQGDLTEALQQAGATLLHWQRLEKPLRQTLSLRTDYAGLLTLLQVLPAGLRIEQINIEMQSENMTVRFVLQDATGGDVDE